MFTKRVGFMRKTNKKIELFSLLYLLVQTASDPAFIGQPCPLNRLSKPIVFVFHLINVKVILARCCFFFTQPTRGEKLLGREIRSDLDNVLNKTLV